MGVVYFRAAVKGHVCVDGDVCQVMGVELLGHRKRLLYGVQELCEAHPDWQNSDDLKPLTKQVGHVPGNSLPYQFI